MATTYYGQMSGDEKLAFRRETAVKLGFDLDAVDEAKVLAFMVDLAIIAARADRFMGTEIFPGKPVIHQRKDGTICVLSANGVKARTAMLYWAWVQMDRVYHLLLALGFDEVAVRGLWARSQETAWTTIRESGKNWKAGSGKRGGRKQAARIAQRSRQLIRGQAKRRSALNRLARLVVGPKAKSE